MSSKEKTGMDYSIMLADLKKKRSVLDSLISSFEIALASGALSSSDISSNGTVLAEMPSLGSVSGLSEIPNGAFLGMNIPDAAKVYLSMVRKKQTTKEIADALKHGGIESRANDFENTVGAGLRRSMKASKEIVRVGDTWGLKEWYPAGILSGAKPGRKSGKKHHRKTNKSSLSLSQQIRDLLGSAPQRIFKPRDVMVELNMKDGKPAKDIMSRLAKLGEIERLGQGQYQAKR
jgi:hypothetical protein